jgi:hypothetical protein
VARALGGRSEQGAPSARWEVGWQRWQVGGGRLGEGGEWEAAGWGQRVAEERRQRAASGGQGGVDGVGG